MDYPGSAVTPTHLHTYSEACWGLVLLRMNTAFSTAGTFTWPSANLAIYMPISLKYPYEVKRVFWANGSTAGGNVDFGIYTPSGTRIYSTGSTAQSAANVTQYVSPTTAFTLAPGRYFFAISSSSTTNALCGGLPNSANTMRLCGFLQEASAVPLPATATFAAIANPAFAFCGVTRTASGF